MNLHCRPQLPGFGPLRRATLLVTLVAFAASVEAQPDPAGPPIESWTAWIEAHPEGLSGEPVSVDPDRPWRSTLGGLTIYSDAPTFDTDFPGEPIEDFEESPVPPFGVTGCDEPLDDTSSDACFSPGDIMSTMSERTFEGIRGGCPVECPLVVLGDGLIGQADVIAGPNFFADTLLFETTEESCALGFFIHVPAAETFDVTLTTQAGVFPLTAPASPTGLFWGVATNADPILSVRLVSPAGGGELIDNVRVATDSCSVGVVTATKVDIPGGAAVPGDTISYQVDISSLGPDEAAAVVFTDTPDPNTTLAGSPTTTPLARDDGLYSGSPTVPTTVDGTLQPLLLDNDFGIPGTPTLAALPAIAQPTTLGGSVDINADGSFTYTPPGGATGGETDTFTYDVQNGVPPSSPVTDTATASVLLGLGPSAANDALSATQNTVTPLDSAADNGFGADVFGIPVGAVDFYGPVGGPLTTAPGNALALASGNTVNFDVSGNGLFTYDATVNPTFSGDDTLEYQITNPVGSDTAVVTITVQAPPTAVDDAPNMLSVPGDAFHTPLNTALDTNVHATPSALNNDDRGFPLADAVSYGTSGSPTDQTIPGPPTPTDNGGTVLMSGDGNFVYTPPSPTFTGPDTFGYRIQNVVGFDDGVVTIAVGTRPVCDDEVAPDDYDALGNVDITVPAASGVLIGDTGDGITVTGNTAPVSGGTAAVAADGSFTYVSGAGFNGDDMFTYTVGNGFGDSASCSVEVVVANTVWFIDNTAAAGGDGTLATPYNSLSAYATPALDDAGDVIFIDEGDSSSTNYDTGITLKNNQLLIGQGVDLTTTAGLTLPPFSSPLPGVAGRPTILNTGGAGIVLANGDLVTGLDIGSAAGAGISGSGNAGATIAEVGIGATGSDGLVFSNATGTIDIDNVDIANSSTIGVNISGGSASFDFDSNSSITSPSGIGIRINGASSDFTYNGSITQPNNAATVSITNHTGGTVTFQNGTISATNGSGLQFSNADGTYTFGGTVTLNGGDAGIDILGGSSGTFTFASTTITTPTNGALNVDSSSPAITYSAGSITQNSDATAYRANGNSGGIQNIAVPITANTSTATGISLTNNNGATINLIGALDIDTTSGSGFLATGGGTVANDSSDTNTVTTTTGTGVNVSDTIIGAGGLTFQSVSVNGGGTTNPGIILDDTGAGTFTVTGTGTTNGSGGTIQDVVQDAIRLFNTDGLISLSNMTIEDIGNMGAAAPGHHGIDGQLVDGGLTLNNVTIQRVTDSAIHGEAGGGGSTTWDGLSIIDSTLVNSNRFHVAGQADGGATDEAMVTIEGITGTVVITGNDFDDGPGFVNLFTAAAGSVDITVQSNTFDDGRKDLAGVPSVGGSAVRVNNVGSISSAIRIGDPLEASSVLGNTFTDAGSDASIFIGGFSASDAADVDLVISRNTVTVLDHTSPPGLCSPASCAFDFPNGGIGVESRGSGTFEAIISQNTLTETQNSGGLSTGSLRVDVSGDDTEVIVRNNTLTRSWDGTLFIRADDADGNGATGFLLVDGNTYNSGLIGVSGSGDDLDVIGFPNSPSPFLPSRFQIRNGARLDLTVDDDDMVSHDTATNPQFDSFDMRINGDTGGTSSTFNVLIRDSEGPDGFRLRNDDSGVDGTDSEFNLSRGVSADPAATDISAAQAQSVLDDNGDTTGGGATSADVPFSGVNIVVTTPTLPVVTPP